MSTIGRVAFVVFGPTTLGAGACERGGDDERRAEGAMAIESSKLL